MISRRTLLRGAGGLALAMPLLQILPGRANAAPSFPKRFIVVFNPNGTLKERWSPQGTESNFTLPQITAPLERHKSRCVFFDGVDNQVADVGPGGPHNRGMATVLTGEIILEGPFADGDGQRAGWAGGISVDQFIAKELNAQTRFKSLELGVRAIENEPRARISYLGPDQPLPPENNPVNVWQRLFSPIDQDPEILRKTVVQRRSVIDLVLGDFQRLNRKLATEDRQKLSNHLDSVRDLERRLEISADGPMLCTRPGRPADLDVASEDNFERVARQQIDLMVLALACDLTRVASLEFSSAVNALRFTFMGLRDQDGHSLSHAGDQSTDLQDQWALMLTWYNEQVAYLLDSLAAVPEGEGTLLDNTLVLCCNELSRGNSHAHDSIPFILAGGAGGALRGGRHLVFAGESHNNLLLSTCHLMGVEAERFGNPDFNTRPLPI
ncbi:MAG: DUF1552 domain-containing protein [Myxococcales bacterium]|nr:DUF1552 domain-containing protein [Myxococcales bacterium]